MDVSFLNHAGFSPSHCVGMFRQHCVGMKLIEQRSLLETKDALVTKTKEKLARSAKMQVRRFFVCASFHPRKKNAGTL